MQEQKEPMTYEEAIKTLKEPCLCDYDLSATIETCDISYCDKREAMFAAISALDLIARYEARGVNVKEACEKQVPKKPKIVAPLEGVSFERYVCPNCNTVVADFIERNFVKLPTCYCGQRLNWSEVISE